jgi:hypothetical protein
MYKNVYYINVLYPSSLGNQFPFYEQRVLWRGINSEDPDHRLSLIMGR